MEDFKHLTWKVLGRFWEYAGAYTTLGKPELHLFFKKRWYEDCKG